MRMGVQAQADRDAYDLLTVTERCSFCPGWMFIGTAVEGRTAAQEHRVQFHPEAVQRRRNRKHIGNWVQTQAEQLKASETARIKRAFLLGIELPSE